MKNIFLAMVAALTLCASEASAAPAFEIGYSTFATAGIRCSSGTAIQINLNRPTGFLASVAGYRVFNADSADSVWLGGVSVSTLPATAINASHTFTNLGEEVKPAASAPWPLGKDYGRGGVPLVPLYCKASDDAGAAGAVISVTWFGY